MIDLLTAWNLLEPSERPEGMEYREPRFDIRGCWACNDVCCCDYARDLLCQAVEGVLLNSERREWSFWHDRAGGGYRWSASDVMGEYHPDRLTAACMALQAERGE